MLVVVFVIQTTVAQVRTLDDRVDSLLVLMTTEEKILQLHQEGWMNTADNARLNIPGFLMADGPHGVREGKATSFPVGIGMAAMWDRELAFRIGVAMGKEFRGKGKHQALGPCLDLDRDPRNGRSAETGGEDPYLNAQTTTAVTKGIQSTPAIATIKHFNINHRENGRTTNNVTASMRMLMETNGLTFRTAVQEAGAMCVMNAYNLINGEKCAENPTLLTTILRDHWGFPFYVVSDWGSIWDPKKAISAGCDLEMGSNLYAENLPSLVANGQVSEAILNQAVRRVLRTKLMAGMLDYQPEGDPADVNSIAHQQLCLEAARKSIVLLKNQDNILPLSKNSISKIALIGPSAAVAQIDGGGSAYVTPFYSISPKQGLESKIDPSKISFVKGCDINSTDTSGFAAARSAASSADVVIFVGGLDPSQESEGMDRVGGSVDLPGKQQALINALAQVNSKIIVVIYSGGICGVHNSINNIKGLVYAFYPGQEAGNALADILFGDINPSGKLPVTMPKGSGLLPTWNDDINAGLGGGYRWFDAKNYPVEFPFGKGLSYTTFEYSNLVVTPQPVPFGSPITVSVDVKNIGSRFGEEVVQLYLSHNSAVPMPVKELKGFTRVALQPGEIRTATFQLTNDELYYFNETSKAYEVEPGEKVIAVGTSSDSLLLTKTITINDGEQKPDLRLTNLKIVPPYPIKGQKVTFAAMVKNEGTGATTAGTPIPISYRVNGIEYATSSQYTQSIPAGGMAFIEADGGPGGTNLWSADSLGLYDISAVVDQDNTIAECVETNNSISSSLRVYPTPPVNIALHKTVTVSSVENASLGGDNAVDGNFSTRWSSAFSDPQFIIIDLGKVYTLTDIVLYWETAYAKSYQVLISDGVEPYKNIFAESNGDGGIDKITTTESARYVQIYCIQRATQWGNSLFEVVIHGGEPTGVEFEGRPNIPAEVVLSQNYPNPFNPVTTIRYSIPQNLSGVTVTVKIYDVLGKEVTTLVSEEKEAGMHTTVWNASSISSGFYYCTLRAGNVVRTKKLILIK
jgi:beta-glucosidase